MQVEVDYVAALYMATDAYAICVINRPTAKAERQRSGEGGVKCNSPQPNNEGLAGRNGATNDDTLEMNLAIASDR